MAITSLYFVQWLIHKFEKYIKQFIRHNKDVYIYTQPIMNKSETRRDETRRRPEKKHPKAQIKV